MYLSKDYCAPRTNYADVRHRVGTAFGEKANEIADAIGVVQGLSKETVRPRLVSRPRGGAQWGGHAARASRVG